MRDMKRVLMFCLRDWLNPQAGAVEQYVHEVFSRIVGRGHYVAWVSHCYGGWFGRGKKSPRLETVDSIQMARLGMRHSYRAMMKFFIERLKEKGKLAGTFDVVVDCVNGRPLRAVKTADIPVLPIVFGLARRTRPTAGTLPGPVVAATNCAKRQLQRSGVPKRCIIHAPYGVDPVPCTPSREHAERPRFVAVDKRPRTLLSVVARTKKMGMDLELDLLAPARSPRAASAPGDSGSSREERLQRYREAWFGYCGLGCESEALAMGACGLPVVCPATEAGGEFIEAGETGLLFEPGDAAGLMDHLRRLAEDEVLRARLGSEARRRTQTATWDRTASLVLGAIENL
ncbi:MAG TPA: glycosyltransferase family 4 protein [Candidatus Hydrogenedentes bacterium]|nr:glycosyltransferase family 4 protein [Candidatus Hydrogenedentota bacterium]